VFLVVRIEVTVVVDKKTWRALQVIAETMEDIATDFPYRDDVKRGVKAARYLLNHVRLETKAEEEGES
jgi:hypothetical protein